MTSVLSRDGDVVVGDDWVAPDAIAPSEMRAHRERRGLFSLLASPITRKIVTFNLVALCFLIAGISYLNSSRNSLAVQRAVALVSEAELIADVIEAQLPTGVPVNLATGGGVDIYATLDGLDLRNGTEVFIFDPSETLIANTSGTIDVMGASEDIAPSSTVLTDGLNWLWSIISSLFAANSTDEIRSVEKQLKSSVSASLVQGTQLQNALDADFLSWFGVITPIKQGTESVGVVAVTSASGEIDALVRRENENMLQMFIIATLVSIGLSLALAATIANPLSDLAAAAEQGRDKNSRKVNPGRIRIPDLTARRDELGRLSGALRGMISA
ncbi:sensor N-terminal transmembrane domain-containing protein, partial [Ascidiaceihabitans sp.]|nr:sensor N-terminal transmembrane domain-containing protein [Ascidiaceihabitans sp.]